MWGKERHWGLNMKLPFQHHILLVEDSLADAHLTQEVIRDCAPRVEVHWVRDGVEALDFLRRRAPHQAAPTPHLVLLDLNMPRMDGRRTLQEIRRDERLRLIPVVVLTTSSSEFDLEAAYRDHANAYVVKPLDLDDLYAKVRGLCAFWLQGVAEIPDVSGC